VSTPTFYRGGASLSPRRSEVKIDSRSGLVLPLRGVSISTRPDGLERFGGAHLLGDLPQELKVVQVGRDPHHYEIVPVTPMTFDDYESLLQSVPLTSV
jgi:hypothetical protein